MGVLHDTHQHINVNELERVVDFALERKLWVDTAASVGYWIKNHRTSQAD